MSEIEVGMKITGDEPTEANGWTKLPVEVATDAWRKAIGRVIRVTDPGGEIGAARVLSIEGDEVRLRLFTSPMTFTRGLDDETIFKMIQATLRGGISSVPNTPDTQEAQHEC